VVGLAIVMLAITTALVAFLEGPVGIVDASPVYLLAVVVVGSRSGSAAAIATGIVAFIVYDVLFTDPRLSFVVADPQEWLDLLIFLLVAVAIGRLAAIERERTIEADRQAREAASLFAISRLLATAPTLADAAPEVARRLVADAALARVWITVPEAGRDSLLADTDPGTTVPNPSVVTTLVRTPGDEPAHWTRTHQPGPPREAERREAPADPSMIVLRVGIEAGGDRLGTVWAARDRVAGVPAGDETRILALAADQIALAIRRERSRRDATAAEIARQGDALKSALLDSVSHDLRTPLASIRALAGGLADPEIAGSGEERRATATRIDEEAARLDRLVREVLDLSRIGAGSLQPELESLDLVSVVRAVIERLGPSLGERPIRWELPEELTVSADAVLLETIVTNLVENVARHALAPAPMLVAGGPVAPGWVELRIEDGGPGVPPDALPHLIDRFYRVPRVGAGPRPGLGIGLSVVQGLVAAQGGTVTAARSSLGGLSIAVRLRAGATPLDDRA
jgi:two-component system, OmpR family, sensor histidine kinase KdpD